MKTTFPFIFLLVLLCLINGRVNAQTYQPYPETAAIWMFEHIFETGGGPGYEYNRYAWLDDTTINTQTYRKVYAGAGVMWNDPSGPMTYIGAVRQDVTNQQLFFLDLNDVEHDISIDQFLEAGDTIQNSPNLGVAFLMGPGYLTEEYIDYYVVREVFTEAITGEERTAYDLKVVYVNADPQDEGPSLQYISGIGAYEVNLFENAIMLRCHAVDSMLVGGGQEPNPYDQNCILGVNEEILRFSVAPNPATEEVTITLLQDKGAQTDLQIFDLTGKPALVVSDYVFGDNLIVSSLKPGSYIIGFQLNGRQYAYPLQLMH